MIPKIIHYCWFGGKEKDEFTQKCISSWKKYCKGYEIIEWNESNFDINCNKYVKEAYQAKKWAFVADYVRLYVVNQYGGIYFDTDVEVIKPIDDLLDCRAFFCYEENFNINTGSGFGSVKDNEILKLMLKDYKDISFINKDGTYDITTCVLRNTEAIYDKYISKIEDYKSVCNIDGCVFLPREYMCPYDYKTGRMNKTSNTYSIHWYNASWQNSFTKIKSKIKKIIKKIIK